MSNTPVDAFIGAVNFCTGSQSDYSTCIANNMRFTPFLDDTYEASSFAGLSIKKQDLPLIYGDVYVDLKPIAIANIFARIKMTNSYGGVSFRCSDVFNRPRLPLPRLQDLGIPAQDIVNIIGVEPPEPGDDDDSLTFEGIPISDDDSEPGWLFNTINLLIGYTTAVSDTMTKGKEIKGIILGMLNYYELPELSTDMQDLGDKSNRIYLKALEYINKLIAKTGQVKQTAIEIKYYLDIAESYMAIVRNEIVTKIVNPLSIITPSTDFGTFDYTITDQVATDIKTQESDYYPYIFSFSMQAKNTSGVYGIPPLYPKDDAVVAKKIVDIYASVIRNTVADSLALISRLYTVDDSMDEQLDKLDANELFYNDLKSRRNYYTTQAASYINAQTIPDPDDNDLEEQNSKYIILINQLNVLLDTFTFDSLRANIEAVFDPENSDTFELKNKAIDDYYNDYGNESNIELYNLADKQADLYNTSSDDITEVFLGADYKDAGKFYYADIAYAVGYAKLRNFKSIQIDDEYYELTETVDGLSESGCIKYTFTRHVLPTYSVEVQMYVYPGTPNQPYCPTVNKYHNFLTSKYSGIFTKMDDGEMGLFVFKNYRPMLATVEEVLKVGHMDLNSINLNDPSLDQKAYETMVMKEIKNLTNASSINNEPLSTADFKYYLSSTLDKPEEAANYPGLAMIEFINFPLGTSSKMPKIRINIVGEDLV